MNTEAKDCLFSTIADHCACEYQSRNRTLIQHTDRGAFRYWENGVTTEQVSWRVHLSLRSHRLYLLPVWSLVELLEAYPTDMGQLAQPRWWDGSWVCIGLVMSMYSIPGLKDFAIPAHYWQTHFPDRLRYGPEQMYAHGVDMVSELMTDRVLSAAQLHHRYSVTVETQAAGRTALFIQTHQKSC